MKKEIFEISGMSCTHCSGRIEKAVAHIKGVARAKVDLAAKELTVKFNEKVVTSMDIIKCVEETGYKAGEGRPIA